MEEENQRPKRRATNKKLKGRRIVIVFIILALMISTFVIIFTHGKKEETPIVEEKVNMGKHGEYSKYPKKILGSWTTDGVTIYHFDDDDTGYLRTSLKDYVFTYSIVGNKLYINFADEGSTDSDYSILIKDNTLELKGINKTSGEYTLTKQ